MIKKISVFLIIVYAISLFINIFIFNLEAVCGWFCALIAQIQVLKGEIYYD